MRRPTKEDFEATAQGTSIEVRFKPTNSIFLFAILADLDDVVAFGPVGPGTVRHGGPTVSDVLRPPFGRMDDGRGCAISESEIGLCLHLTIRLSLRRAASVDLK
jgi:hypothetical protein